MTRTEFYLKACIAFAGNNKVLAEKFSVAIEQRKKEAKKRKACALNSYSEWPMATLLL